MSVSAQTELDNTEGLLRELREGRMVVIMDDADRENEGDLLMAAEMVRPEDINFMARFGRGLICLTLTRERCRQLRLPLMVSSNESAHGTAFTLSIEAAEGVTTGISAYDRALTIRTAVAPNAKPEDLVQPGHIFPLMAQPGGVLTRAGHTEAGCDLTRLAGMEPAAVIVEILNEDGTMARRGDLETFASRHGLKMGTIADLIRYRLVNEQTVERMAECSLQTDFGEFRLIAFEDTMHRLLHFALVKGDPGRADAPLVRVQLPDTLRDLLSGRIDDGSRPLRSAMERVAQEPCGIVVILAHEEPADELVRRIRMLGMEQDAHRSPVAGGASGSDLRTYGVGAQILRDLGVQRMRVVGAPRRLHGISGFGLDVVDYVD